MTGRGRHFAFLFLFLVRMACLAYAVCVWELMTSIKTRRAECLSRFLSWAAPLCQRAVCLGHFAGGPAMVTVRRYTGESVLLHKARWEEDGGLGEGPPFRAREREFLPPKKSNSPEPQRRASSFRRRMVRWQMATARASVVSRAQPSPRTLSRRRTMKATCSFSARPVPTTDFLTSVGS